MPSDDPLADLEEIDAALAEIEDELGGTKAGGAIDEARKYLAIARNALEHDGN